MTLKNEIELTETCPQCGDPWGESAEAPCPCGYSSKIQNNHDEHYVGQEVEPIDLQEMIGARLDKTNLTYVQKHSAIAALKYAKRIGQKKGEDIVKEADKIANYLHRAFTGRWIGR